jgi:predicted enzyme related to lactoylglutathione lyase
MTVGIRKAGDFCWINMLTPQPDAAREFFSAVLGWTYSEIPGMGHSIEVGGRPLGGLFDLNGPGTPPGMSPHIGVMIKVDSADATAQRVAELGGQARASFDVGDKGRMTVCIDPNGAAFDVWEPKQSHGTEVDGKLPGAPSWFETMTTDAAKAEAFYAGLFGWEAEASPNSAVKYFSFKHHGIPIAGMLQLTPEMGSMPPVWATYFTVTNADETAAKAKERGGKLCMGPQDVHGIGRFAALLSPQGVFFYVIHYFN